MIHWKLEHIIVVGMHLQEDQYHCFMCGWDALIVYSRKNQIVFEFFNKLAVISYYSICKFNRRPTIVKWILLKY